MPLVPRMPNALREDKYSSWFTVSLGPEQSLLLNPSLSSSVTL